MNLLSRETSPYLRQHMDNPVEWMPWGEAALEKARAENKPILLSVGYSACHWCHVMAHESFEDAATADLMNTNFVNIKVDREERPDIDTLYQGALSLMGQAGGWPLTMFLTPEARPFWGGTYFPPQARQGMPSFKEVLRALAESFSRDPDKITHNVRGMTAALAKIHSNQPGGLVRSESLETFSGQLLALVDPANGGIGTAPKFPNLPALALLWDYYTRTSDGDYKAAVIHSLTQMCQGGIYDHIGGGFSRYSVDAEWLVPHFEKMLSDNALFVSLLTEVYKETQHPLFAQRISETVSWVRRDLAVRDRSYTAFAASLDADSAGEEGRYYVWTEEEVRKILGAEAEAFNKIYDVTKFGNWEGINILNRLKNPDYKSGAEEMQAGEWLAKLRRARDKRVPPALDNKVLADWNGLMMSALARAGATLQCREWVDAALSAFHFVTTYMMDKDGRLFHSWCQGATRHAGLLDDYAYMAEAALTLYSITSDPALLTRAVTWARILDTDFWDPEHHGYFTSSSRVQDLPLRPKSAHDGSIPSGNGVMAGVLTRLYLLTGDKEYRERAEKTITAFTGELQHYSFPFSTLLQQDAFFLNPVSVIIVAKPGAADAEALRKTLHTVSIPSLIRMEIAPENIFPKNHLAFGKTALDGKATAYVCAGHSCFEPVTAAADLDRLLKQVRHDQGRNAANDG